VVHLRAGLTFGRMEWAFEVGRTEAPVRDIEWYYQEWTPRAALSVHLAPHRVVDPLLGAGVGVERVRVAGGDDWGEIPFVHNPAFGPLVHAGGGLLVNLVGPAFLRMEARALLPFGPQRVEGASLRPAVEGLAGLDIRFGATTDRDGDGLSDTDDVCPREREDLDGRDDEDGCPDLDDDRDGVAGELDRCPDTAEDRDGFDDSDGCPDPDNDGDGILDVRDRCAREPEDVDRFSDDDGCPDLDNDQDGIPDLQDACANDPETKNGIDDTDGCPDR
jgi:hypothetical protein